MIPSKETGIRRFCLWAIGLAVLTLRKIERNPRFTAGAQVKVTRRAVAMTRLLTDVAGRSDGALRRLFALAERHVNAADAVVSNLARALFVHHPHFFTFVHEEGVEPTNNIAERALRTAVQWRKIMVFD